LRVLLAGGGTAGHVNPLLATAAALQDPALGGDPRTQILVLGTAEGLENRLVPESGFELALVPRVPLPRRPSGDLLRLLRGRRRDRPGRETPGFVGRVLGGWLARRFG